tara:strand:- start:106 stop:588 length:483 start_codon:yes stop_codon:yes gene_type:complete
MKIQYTYTSDVDELPEKVAVNLEFLYERLKIYENLAELIRHLKEDKKVDWQKSLHLLKEIGDENYKLMALIKESYNILEACRQIEEGEVKPPESQAPAVAAQERQEPDVATQERQEPDLADLTVKQEQKLASLQSSVMQLSQLAQTLGQMKSPEEVKEAS